MFIRRKNKRFSIFQFENSIYFSGEKVAFFMEKDMVLKQFFLKQNRKNSFFTEGF